MTLIIYVTGGAVAPVIAPASAPTGPIGWILGADSNNQTGQVTYDCWKPVLHDESKEPSQGKPLKDVIADPRIKEVVHHGSENSGLNSLTNIWGEKFETTPITIPWTGQVLLHATKVY